MWTNLWEHLVFSPLSSRSSGSRHSSYCNRSSISKCLTISWTLRGPLGSSCPCQSLPAPGPLDPLWPPAEMPSQPAPSASELEGRGRRTLCWESSCWGATRLPTQTNPSWRFDGFAGTETASLGASGSRHSWRSDVAQSDASPFTLHSHSSTFDLMIYHNLATQRCRFFVRSSSACHRDTNTHTHTWLPAGLCWSVPFLSQTTVPF